MVCTGRWPGAGLGGVVAVKYPVEPEELKLYARVHDLAGLPEPWRRAGTAQRLVERKVQPVRWQEDCHTTLCREQPETSDGSSSDSSGESGKI